MIYVGIDDTDTPDSPGTNQLARALAALVAGRYACALIVRHQLLQDPRVPMTSKNSAASIHLQPENGSEVGPLIDGLREAVRRRFVEGSDPGLCVAASVPQEVTAFGRRCQQELTGQWEARRLAAGHGIHLEGLGGTEDGVVGALAAVGLAAGGNDGRVVQIGAWPDDLCGPQDVQMLWARGVEVRSIDAGRRITAGRVDVGKHLRPSYRQNRAVLFVRPDTEEHAEVSFWHAVRLP